MSKHSDRRRGSELIGGLGRLVGLRLRELIDGGSELIGGLGRRWNRGESLREWARESFERWELQMRQMAVWVWGRSTAWDDCWVDDVEDDKGRRRWAWESFVRELRASVTLRERGEREKKIKKKKKKKPNLYYFNPGLNNNEYKI